MQSLWTRRRFLHSAGLTAVAQPAAKLAQSSLLAGTDRSMYAYAAVQQQDRSGIQIFARHGHAWIATHFMASFAPSAVVLHPAGSHLFVANARTRYKGLPTASVQSFRIHPKDGTLKLQSQQHLAMAAILPSALALSPDGSLLVIAAAHGVFNLTPVTGSGDLLEVTAARKEFVSPTTQVESMHFVSKDRLMARAEGVCSTYECDRNGMALVSRGMDRSSTPSVEIAPLNFDEVAGLKAVTFSMRHS